MKSLGTTTEAPVTRQWSKHGDEWAKVLELNPGEWAHFEAESLDESLSFTQSMRYRGKSESIAVSVRRKQKHIWVSKVEVFLPRSKGAVL